MLGPHWGAAGLWSRYARHRVIAPCPEKQRDRFVSETSAFLARTGPVVAYPASERSIDALVDVARALPERAQLPFPAGGAVNRLRDKRELAKLAGGLDLAVPTIWEGRAGSLAAASFPLPALVKSRGPSESPPPVRVVESPDDLRSAALELPMEEAVLVQPYIRAPLLMLALVIDREGRPVSRFAQVAERTWPRQAGMAAVIASVSPDHDLVDAAVELLARRILRARSARLPGHRRRPEADRRESAVLRLFAARPRVRSKPACGMACGGHGDAPSNRAALPCRCQL